MRAEPYIEFLCEREELMRHKWVMSEKAGKDVGFEAALVDWAFNHRSEWRKQCNHVIGVDERRPGKLV
jgi:hypothetical protein